MEQFGSLTRNCQQSDCMNPEISEPFQKHDCHKRKKRLVQYAKRLKRQTKEEKGLVYNPHLQDLDKILDSNKTKKQERSLKINCVGDAFIVKDLKYLNFQYRPRKKENKREGLTDNSKNEHWVQKRYKQAIQQKKAVDFSQRKQWLQSWDLQEQGQQQVDFFVSFILLIILLLLVSRQIRENVYRNYQAMRKLLDQ